MRNVKRPPRRVLPESAAVESRAETPRSEKEVYRSERGAEAPQRVQSIDFRSFQPGHMFGPEARLQGVVFEALTPSEDLLVVGTRSEAAALLFPPSGLRIRLPATTSYLALTGWFEGRPAGAGRICDDELSEPALLESSPPSRYEIGGREINHVILLAGGGLLVEIVWSSDAAAALPDQ